jgi:SSS family solute:Na+ symporter
MAGLTGFQNATYPLTIAGMTIPGYAALYTLIINVAVAAVATVVLNAIGSAERTDETVVTDYA